LPMLLELHELTTKNSTNTLAVALAIQLGVIPRLG